MDSSNNSSDTVESSRHEPRTSKKRKLDGTEATVSPASFDIASEVFRVLYLTTCSAVRQLEALTEDPEHTNRYSVEHMKSSLKSSPEDAAHILGSSFYLTNRLIQTPQRYWNQQRSFTIELQTLLADTGYEFCIFPMIDLWNRRSLIGQNSSTSSNVRNPKKSFRNIC